MPSATGFAYDGFVVHAAADEWFVRAYLLDKLGLSPDRVLVPGALELGRSLIGRRGRLLALADYHALGDGSRTGLAFAIKEHADDVLGTLTSAQQPIALRIFLRLVAFGAGRAIRDDSSRGTPCAPMERRQRTSIPSCSGSWRTAW